MKNKIKGSVESLNPVKLCIAFLIGLVICVPLRFYEVFKLIDGKTGFYIKQSPLTPVFFIALTLFCVLIAVGGYVSGSERSIEPGFFRKKYPAIIFELLLAGAFTLDSMLALTRDLSNSAIIHQSTILTGKFVPLKLQALFAVLSGLYFFILAIRSLMGKTAKLRIFALCPVFWGIIKLITLFVNQISYMRISDLVLEIAATALLTVFFLSFAQCLSGVYSEVAGWRILGIGLPAALVCFCINMPKLAAVFTGNSEKINSDFPVCYVEIIVAVLIILTATYLFKKEDSPAEITEIADRENTIELKTVETVETEAEEDNIDTQTE